jgi:uncharacterized protein (DUF433 family)
MSAPTANPVDIGTLIVRSPEIKRGAPRIAGTGVTVKRIVGWYKQGMSAEEISAEVGHISVGQVHAALAYYHANKNEIEAALLDEEIEYERLSREFQSSDRPA